MKLEMTNDRPSTNNWLPWALVGAGILLHIFVASGAEGLPQSVSLGIMGPLGMAMILLGLRGFAGKPILPRSAWTIVVGMLLIMAVGYFYVTMDLPLWLSLSFIAVIIAYVWLQSRRIVP
jgi:hypothetical protein